MVNIVKVGIFILGLKKVGCRDALYALQSVVDSYTLSVLYPLPLLVSILALYGDIHINPDPPASSSFSLCTYNIRSLLSNDNISALNDFIETHHPNIIALTETWINKSSTPSKLANATPSGLHPTYPYYNKITSLTKPWVVELPFSSLTQFL